MDHVIHMFSYWHNNKEGKNENVADIFKYYSAPIISNIVLSVLTYFLKNIESL